MIYNNDLSKEDEEPLCSTFCDALQFVGQTLFSSAERIFEAVYFLQIRCMDPRQTGCIWYALFLSLNNKIVYIFF